jgi:hypothetical protein
MSNGSISKNSANVMSINYSVLLSLYWQYPTHIFSRYKRIREAYEQGITIGEELEPPETTETTEKERATW